MSNSNPRDGLLMAAFDVETTGLSARFGDRICEVGIVLCRDGEILDSYQTLVNPARLLSPGAARVNGLTDAQLRDAPLFSEIASQVLDRLAGAVLVCHNAPFDLSFLDAELARLGQLFQPIGVIDTLDIARRYFHFPSNSLSCLAATLQLETPQAHRALGDAYTTLQVLGHFSSHLSNLEITLHAESAGAYNQPIPRELDLHLPPALQEALSDQLEVEITYIDAKGDETVRRITPRFVQAQKDYIYLVAFCHLREAERSFRLDRIVAISLLE
jgi:DNA polymerase III subunit epsilon